MNDVIQRLRATASVETTESFNAGVAAGQQWAKDEATKSQLHRLSKKMRESWNSCEALLTSGPSAYTHDEQLAAVILGKQSPDREEKSEFWEYILGDELDCLNDDYWLEGFVTGSLDIWRQVEGRL
jgi:hypothetical protein